MEAAGVAKAVYALVNAIVSQILTFWDLLEADAKELHRHLSSLRHLIEGIVLSPEGQQALKTPEATRALSDLAESLRDFKGLITKMQNMKKCTRFLRAGDLLRDIRSAGAILDNKIQVLQTVVIMRSAGSQERVLYNQEHLLRQFEATREGMRLMRLELLQSYNEGSKQLQSRMEEVLMGPGGAAERLEVTIRKAVQQALERHGVGLDKEEKEDLQAALQELRDKVAELRAAEVRREQQLQQQQQQCTAPEVPGHFRCPITLFIMRDPVTLETHTFERAAIARHLRRFNTNPMTNAPLGSREVRPNLAVKEDIAKWLQAHNMTFEDVDRMDGKVRGRPFPYPCSKPPKPTGPVRGIPPIPQPADKGEQQELEEPGNKNEVEQQEVKGEDGKRPHDLDKEKGRGDTSARLAQHQGSTPPEGSKAPGPLEDAADKGKAPQVAATPEESQLLNECGAIKPDVEAVIKLLEEGTNVNADKDGYTCLHAAARNGHSLIVRLLLALRADVDPRTKLCSTPLHLAAQHGHAKACLLLLDEGADPRARDGDGKTPLDLARRTGHAAVVELLGGRTERVVRAVGSGVTAGRAPLLLPRASTKDELHLLSVCARNHMPGVLWLVDGGTAVNVVDKEGRTPLHWLAFYGKSVMAAVLLKAGANPHAQSSGGSTPLHCAASPRWRFGEEGHWKAARMLLAAGADPGARDASGRTPLHCAAFIPLVRPWDMKMVRTLLAAGADPWAKDADGNTPRDLAKKTKRMHMSALLKQHDRAWHHGSSPGTPRATSRTSWRFIDSTGARHHGCLASP